MPTHRGKHGHGGKPSRNQVSNADAPPTLAAPDPGPVGSNTATDATDSMPPDSSTTAAASEVRHELHHEAATNKAQEVPAQSAAVVSTVGEQQPQQGLGEPVTLRATSPKAADQADSTTTASQVSTSKRSGKRRKGEKRREKMQRATNAHDGTRMQLLGTLPQPAADIDARDALVAASATSGALKGSSDEGAADKQQDEAPEGSVPEPTVVGTTVEGQGQVQQVSSEPLPPKEALGDPSASHKEVQDPVTAARGSETEAEGLNRLDRLDRLTRRKSMAPSKSRKPSAAELLKTITDLENIVQSPEPSTIRKPSRSLTRTDIIVTSVCVGTGFLFCSLIIVLIAISNQKATKQDFCHTVDCDLHAALLTNDLNWQLDPCEDYAAFVCSAWEYSEYRRDLATTAMDDLRFIWYELFMDTLTRGSLTLPAGKKPLAMYEMCTKSFPKNVSQIRWVRTMLREYGIYWPEAPARALTPLGMAVSLSYKWRWSFWITVNVLRPASSSGKRRVFVSPGHYLLILRRHHHAVAQSYRKYWEQFTISFYPDNATRPPVTEEAADEIRDMERDIIDTLHDASVSSRKRPALFSFSEISEHVPNVSATEWVHDFQAGLLLQPGLNPSDKVIVSDVPFLQTVAKILTKYSTVQLTKHITWLIVQYFSAMADYTLLVRFFGSQNKAELLLPAYCAHHVEASFKVLVLGLAYNTRFEERDRETITKGFKSLVSAAVNSINDAHWMDSQSKALSTEKLLSVKNSLWPPAQLLKDGVLEKIYVEFSEKEPSFAHYWVNTRLSAAAVYRTEEYDDAILLLGNEFPHYADYDYVSNAAKLAMGAASPPAYYRSGTRAMLYGGLLFLMAMQLVKALDSEGIRWAANGTTVGGTILSNSTLAAFRIREECYDGGENASVFPEVPALEVAYSALMESQLQLDGGNSALSEKLPADHVFFMTLCFLTCASGADWNPVPADCNKVVRNSERFAKAYNCPRGSNMNPEKKCSFFT